MPSSCSQRASTSPAVIPTLVVTPRHFQDIQAHLEMKQEAYVKEQVKEQQVLSYKKSKKSSTLCIKSFKKSKKSSKKS
ncbi:hypothetical protein DPMN_058929 [Dreissena polymorpha]|uniref:Uncharacterized protein n=1 Tax=Dreissena polymorpha TaxID=45954 RepID=A0A9D4HEB7_DREPO|nr:hypothetical protein DPMN_058563 [Dreissena polymorpha]KAH3716210.1 hypothetical protein DPMN_058929 [Dreissena polymorpha]